MKKLWTLFIMIFAIVLLTGAVSAKSDKQYDAVINGENNPASDVPNIQNAVDLHRKILLRGTFDFGINGTVKITKDVEIMGDSAVIKNGVTPFVSPLPSGAVPGNAPLSELGPDISIEGIEFDGSGLTPIMINYSRGIRIIGNTIKNVKSYCFGGYSLQLGLEIGTHNCYVSDGIYWANRNYYDKMSLTGIVVVRNNSIDVETDDPICGFTVASGMIVSLTTGAYIEIYRNTVENGNLSSLSLYDNYPNDMDEGNIVVEKNTIKSAPIGNQYFPKTPVAVLVANPFVAPPQLNMLKTTISHNEVELRAKTTGDSSAIVINSALANGTVITSNHLTINKGEDLPNYGIVLYSGENYIGQNKIEGEGFSAYRRRWKNP